MSQGTPPSSISRAGQSVVMDPAGNVVATLSSIRSVGIADLAQVSSHQVNRVAGSTSHVVHFIGGGLLCYAFNSSGELIELSGHRLVVRLAAHNTLVFAAL